MNTLFWLLLFIVFYTYLGYGILLFILIKIKRFFKKPITPLPDPAEWPALTVFIAAYNEILWIHQKLNNCFELDYPKDKLHFYFVTDGSDDGTPEAIAAAPHAGFSVTVWHQSARQGKIAAVARVMPYVTTPFVVFTDANTDLNPTALKALMRPYGDPNIGAVAGEKRVRRADDAAAAGEGIYWTYESLLKRWDAELYSVVGAAGELFSMRTHLFHPVPTDTLIEDFVLTLGIARDGHRVAYAPDAYALETASANVKEEWKRKVRIAAGGLQAIVRLKNLLNPFIFKTLCFQYISHRVLRWTAAPLALPLIFGLNIGLVLRGGAVITSFLMLGQVIFYTAAALGWWLDTRGKKAQLLFVPYYFCVMNAAVYAGFGRLMRRTQSVIWEKSQRKNP